MAAKAKKKAAMKAKPAARKSPAKAAPKKSAAKARARGPEVSSDLRKVALAHALRRLR